MFPDSQPNRKHKSLPVLIVEDNPDHQLLIKYSLGVSIPQSEPVFTATAEAALAYLERGCAKLVPLPQLVLLDLHLPTAEIGWYLLKELRLRYPQLPVLVLSAHHDPQTVRQVYELGAHSFISKPLDLPSWESYFKNLRNYWLGTVTLPPVY